VPLAKPNVTLTEAATKSVDVSVTVHYRDGKLQKGRNAHSFTTMSTKEVLKLILNQITDEDLKELESIEVTTTPASAGQFDWLVRITTTNLRFRLQRKKPVLRPLRRRNIKWLHISCI
jgi:hypothetical protein